MKKPPIVHLESPPPPKRRHIANFQADQKSSIIKPSKQKQSRTDNNSSTSHSRADASSSSSDHPPPQLNAPSFEFNASLPSLDPPPASNLLQSPGEALTEASGPFIDNVLLNLRALAHRTTDQSDDENSVDLEGGAVEAANSVDHETDDLWSGEDVAMEGNVDPREGIVSDWDLLAKDFIVEAEELGKFEHALLHAP
jgi:hypothetical protein